MHPAPAARLLAEIERSGSGSAAFWALFWSVFHQLSGEELRRVLRAAGHRGVQMRLGIGSTGAALEGGGPAT